MAVSHSLMPTRFLFLALHVVVISASSSLVPGGHCRDYNGKLYETGMHYMPGPDSCRLCICDSGLPKACKMVLCEAFTKCKSFQTVGSGNNCCEVICLDDQFNDGSTDFVNRLRQRKIRARESRQNTEDQRSIVGSIGYIAGNMGYMEGNLTSMDYSYGGTATHYPLWKPPSGYFPRGEAPPPYEEAVAISQAEALSAQCAAAAAVAAAAVASPRPMSAVELQSSADISRRAQTAATMQQLQHLQPHQTTTLMPQQTSQHSVVTPHQATAHNVMPIHHVLGAPPAHQQTQSHQITQSTTNLINININSGGNITTIATGENHQPPYSLQNEQSTNNMVQEQQQQTSTTQQNPHQAINTSNVNSNNNSSRLHLAQSNSICVQTMTTQPNMQQQSQQSSIGQTVNSSSVSSSIGISASGKQAAATAECGYKNCHLNTNVTTTTTGTNARRTQRLPEPLQQYVVDVEVNVGNASGSGYHSLSSCSANPANEGEFELIASPTQFGNDFQPTNALSSPAIDTLIPTNSALDVATNNTGADATSQLQNTGHHTLPTQNMPIAKSIASSSANAATASKAFSSSRRYHRTMPRYYTAADPLTSRDNQNTAANTTINTNKSSKQIESKQASMNNANSAATTASSNHNSSKKPTCQCPIQHVPMSYMGSTHLNSQNVTNNAFFTVLSSKLNTGTVNRISNTNNNASSLPYVSQRLNKTFQNHLNNATESNATNSNSKRGALQSHCNYESKIATISTGELVNSASNNIAVAHHHHSHHSHHHGHHSSASLLLPPQHHDDSSSLVLGRVAKRSSSNSSDRFRSASSGSTRNPTNETASISAAYLNSKVDAYLNLSHATTSHHHAATRVNDLMNPALPPKLHKSLTNLKSSTLAPSTPHHAGGGTVKNINKSNDLFKPSSGQLLHSSNINSSINTQTTLTSTSSTSSSSPSSNLGSPQTSSNSSTTSVQTIYTLSKPSTSPAITTLNAVAAAHARNRDHDHLNLKVQPPILTLPSSSSATMSSTISASTFTGGTKINSSTFYPLQNNVTYTLPKNITGKMSLNSTINSVVSKVPSVISLPAAASSKNNQENTAITVAESNSNESNSTVILASVKSTTLPKVLRSKKDFLQPNNGINNSNSVLNNCAAIVSSTACAVSQCNMPAYPKLFNTFNSSIPLISASTSSLSSSSQAATSITTNVAITTRQQCINMQTQTITSTLAGNLYVDDFFTCIPVTSSSVTSTSSGNCKQATLPSCTTSKNYLNGKEHFVPNDTSLDDDYLSECENCKIAQSSKYYLDTAALSSTPQETMTLQRKSLEENKEEAETGYYRISHTLPSNSKKNTPLKSINNREPWFSTIPAASSSSDEDINE